MTERNALTGMGLFLPIPVAMIMAHKEVPIMLFYRIMAEKSEEDRNTDGQDERGNRREQALRANHICLETEVYNDNEKDRGFFVSEITDIKIYAGAVCSEILRKGEAARFLDDLKMKYEKVVVEETTFEKIYSMLCLASRKNYIEDSDDFLMQFGITRLFHRGNFQEELALRPVSRPVLMQRAANILSTALQEELTRILASNSKKPALGHPVHYIIETDDESVFKEIKETLLMALVKAGRLKSRRYVSIDSDDADRDIAWKLYTLAKGGTMILDFPAETNEESQFADVSMSQIQAAARLIKANRNEVLTILRFPKVCHKLKQLLFEKTGSCSFIEITEDIVFNERVRKYLLAKADAHKVIDDENLYKDIKEDTGYSPTDLNVLFDQWMDHHLKNVVYPQYASISNARQYARESSVKGNAYAELQDMIGLGEAKRVIEEALCYYKAQKLFADKGLQTDHPSMHMVFTGNPGTAKTTVARLFARIMKENGLLSEGGLYEVGRSDLVGQYVGWTAKAVKRKFAQAKGSVLFIDEAYSLLERDQGSFGDEAINTIVQEMENHREDMVVIFAGYPDEMEQFLSRNPGLRSRIAYHIPFENYTAKELWDIACLIAEKKGMQIQLEAEEKLLPAFEAAAEQKDFGNGRYVRNIIEKARMKQASRLMKMPIENVTKSDVVTLLAEDFEIAQVEEEKTRIGFFV